MINQKQQHFVLGLGVAKILQNPVYVYNTDLSQHWQGSLPGGKIL